MTRRFGLRFDFGHTFSPESVESVHSVGSQAGHVFGAISPRVERLSRLRLLHCRVVS